VKRAPAVAVAGTPGAWSSEALAEALRNRGADSRVISTSDLVHDLESGDVLCAGESLRSLDAVAVKKAGDAYDVYIEDRLVALEALQAAGVPVFSDPQAIRRTVNRYRMTHFLRQAGVPMPATRVTESVDGAVAAVREWGAAILKPIFTSKGRGMLKLDANVDVAGALRKWQDAGGGPFYLQRFVDAPGRDLAVAVLGGRTIGAYYRVARSGEWMTTTAAGGHYERAAATPELEQIALTATAALGLTYTTVDIVESAGGPLVYEVSAFGGFSGLRDACGIDAADLFAAHVLEQIAP
jgi:ribosomal protein S6--L-glutamate ligase